MDVRSPVAETDPSVARATFRARVAGLGSWSVGWVIFALACWQRSPVLFALFGAWYLALAAIVLVIAASSRRIQLQAGRAHAVLFRELAIRDDLTGLHNRRYFNSELEAQVASCRGANIPLTIALIDLNDFKSINDSFGHAAGDMALRAAGQAILDASPPGATVARTGGDEFAVIMPGRSPADAEGAVRRIHLALEGANFVVDADGGGRGRIQATIGIASLGATADPGELLREADSALYSGKRLLRAA